MNAAAEMVAWFTQILDEIERTVSDPAIARLVAPSEGKDALAEYAVLDGELHASPRYVLARIAADRQILADYEDHLATYRDAPTPSGEGQRFGLLMAVARIAEAHADRPGYQESWRA